MGMFNDLKNISKQENEPVSPPQPKKEPRGEKHTAPVKNPSLQKPSRTPVSSSKQVSNTENNITVNMTSNITILQTDVERLSVPAYKPQTFRIGDEEIDKLKDLSYSLSRTLRRKVTQGDLLRIAILLLEKHMTTNEADLFAILKAIK